jgi:hypothetical protein
MLPRLLGLVTLVVVLMTLIRALSQNFGRPRHPDAHRPRPNARSDSHAAADAVATHLVSRTELAGIRDAFSSAPLDATRPMYRCEGCSSFYQDVSRDAILRENAGHCVVCQGTRLGSVVLIDH